MRLALLAQMATLATILVVPSVTLACSGSPPKPQVCNTIRCTADGWTLWPVAAGTPCSGNGLCDGGILTQGEVTPDQPGSCVSPQVFTPHFHLQTLIYMPPGVQSSVSYLQGSGEGSKIAVQTTTSGGVSVSAVIAGFGGLCFVYRFCN